MCERQPAAIAVLQDLRMHAGSDIKSEPQLQKRKGTHFSEVTSEGVWDSIRHEVDSWHSCDVMKVLYFHCPLFFRTHASLCGHKLPQRNIRRSQLYNSVKMLYELFLVLKEGVVDVGERSAWALCFCPQSAIHCEVEVHGGARSSWWSGGSGGGGGRMRWNRAGSRSR